MFEQKIYPNSPAERIIIANTNIISKSAIAELVFEKTGIEIKNVYYFQKKLGLL